MSNARRLICSYCTLWADEGFATRTPSGLIICQRCAVKHVLSADLATRIDETVEKLRSESRFGVATAAKRGRNPAFPYVPMIQLRADGGQLGGYGSARTRQIKGLAYATRQEAVERAQRSIDHSYLRLADDLANPRNRAQRQQHGLPREI